MQALQVAVFLPLLAGALPEEAGVLLASTLEAEDACAPGATTAECQVSFRQLRGGRTIAEHEAVTAVGREQQDAMVLGVSIGRGLGHKESWNYSIQVYEPGVELYNSFKESRHGATWKFQSAIVAVEAQPQMFETVDDHRPLGLRIEFSSSLTGLLDPHAEVVVARMDDVTVSSELAGGKPNALQKPFFHMAAPNCYGRMDCFSRKPPGGFAAAPNPKLSTSKTVKDVLTFNLTSILDPEHTSVHVWMTPHNVSVDGLWQTGVYKLQNWRFFNLDDSFDEQAPEGESDSYDDWGYYSVLG